MYLESAGTEMLMVSIVMFSSKKIFCVAVEKQSSHQRRVGEGRGEGRREGRGWDGEGGGMG